MAQGALSAEINRHLEAALTLSRIDFVRQLVSEAELCIEFDQTSAAAILAGIALEELSSSRDKTVIQAIEPNIHGWRELRNRAAHPATSGQEGERAAVAAMVTGIRDLLSDIEKPDVAVGSSMHVLNALTSVPGKYVFVPTSVDDFLRRKREDTDLEIRK